MAVADVQRLVGRAHDDGVEHLRLSDPNRSNALGPEMVAALRAALASLPETARAIVLAGAGANFCSGGDHKAFMHLDRTGRKAYFGSIRALLDELRQCPVPTVASVRGAAIGGGVELALSCDLVVAATTARFQLPQVAARVSVDRAALASLVGRTSTGFARRMVLLGEVVDGPTAHAAGLVDALVVDDPDAEAARWAGVLAGHPVDSVAAARRALAAAGRGDGDGWPAPRVTGHGVNEPMRRSET